MNTNIDTPIIKELYLIPILKPNSLNKYTVKGFAKREGYFLICNKYFKSKELAEHAALTQVLKDLLR